MYKYIYNMSNNLVPISLSKTEYPPCRINNVRSWAILKGPGENSYQRFVSTSFNNSQITIIANPPSNKNIVNRLVFIKNVYNLLFTGTSVSGNLLQIGSTDAPRANPIASSTNTCQVSINNDQYTTNLNQYWSALSRYHNTINNRDEFLSMTPAYLDKFQQYSDGLGSARNPLGSYKDSADGEVMRGGFNGNFGATGAGFGNYGINIVSNTPTSANVILTVVEPLYLSPFLFSGEDNLESGLIGVNNLQIVFTNGDLTSTLWSHDAVNGNTITSIVANVVSSEAQFNYLTPQINSVLPLQQSWPYAEITTFPQSVTGDLSNGSLSPNASVKVSMNSIQIKAVPDKIYIVAKRSQATQTVNTTDTFAAITNVSLTYGNRTGLLSTASQNSLYNICLKNGLKMNFSEFANYVGSVICLKPGEDIGLNLVPFRSNSNRITF